MATAVFRNFLYDDQILYGNASGTTLVVTHGDWLAYSGLWVVAANTGVAGWKASGVGIALSNNPYYDKRLVAFA